MREVQMDLISEEKLNRMTSMEKIRLILDKVKTGRIVVLESGLTPEEEVRLIEMTMTEIRVDEFSGIEIESYPAKREGSFVSRILGRGSSKGRMTVIGPANQLRTVEKDQYQISTKVSVGD
ncbi:MAG: DUF2073 domain-containing protein [Methanothrix sp.]|jgi:Uncharacterized protein conserved in archaea|uniref:DUF2073 domain-containing protein n=1 Tax=Methanothrix thermoacetophila (strain DSM 6194 / JCM 14653 / NBRC 101360 / PT) TaxID=349307 RepID=A0B8H5_METTP|nr:MULTISPECIES: DUF2073 domain-containing protein [Methanothrix]ABK14999.1 conserved hypothetical protein [Methanothrix thermoacetophila PT]MBC7080440.1 DUF2073 domain-containing protein [Methanothrix sp.]NPU86907.1 DUF2073 domain-containing protein [Methanothrix sp.]